MEFTPQIVAFLCNWCSHAGVSLPGGEADSYPPNVRVFHVSCASRINPLVIIKALAAGNDGILVSGCPLGDCRDLQGDHVGRRKFAALMAALKLAGRWHDRVFFSWEGAAEGRDFAELIQQTIEAVRQLGPNDDFLQPAPGTAAIAEAEGSS